MNRVILSIAFICFVFELQAQVKGEFSVNYLLGAIRSNELAGTSAEYEDFPAYSSVNLKCRSNNGVGFSYLGFINQSKWFLNGSFESRWLKYSTTIYSANFDPNGPYDKKEDIELRNEYSRINFGAGRRFTLINEKLYWELSFGSNLNFYWDNTISEGELVQSLSTIGPTEIRYKIDLDFKDYDKKLNFYAQSAFSYFPINKIGVQFNCAWTNPIVVGEYKFTVQTRGIPQEVSPGFIIVSSSISNEDVGRVITKYLTFGFGLTYRI